LCCAFVTGWVVEGEMAAFDVTAESFEMLGLAGRALALLW
jgi:hypothetical protein